MCHVVNLIKMICHHNNPTNNSRIKNKTFFLKKANAFLSATSMLSRNEVQSIWTIAMNLQLELATILFQLLHTVPKPQEWAVTLQIKA